MAYDSKEYNKFMANNDYQGYADYLKNFAFANPAKQAAHEARIEQLEREGGMVKSILDSQETEDDRAKIGFALSLRNKTPMSPDNPYQQKYLNELRYLGYDMAGYKNYSRITKGAEYTFHNEKAYEQFVNSLGNDFDKEKASTNTLGQHTYTISHNDLIEPAKGKKFVSALLSVKQPYVKGFWNSVKQGLQNVGLFEDDETVSAWHAKGIHEDKQTGNEYQDYIWTAANGRESALYDMFVDAENAFDKTLDKSFEKTRDTRLNTFSIVNEQDTRLINMKDKGLIKPTEFRAEMKALHAMNLQRFMTNDFSSPLYKQIYKENDAKGLTLSDPNERNEILNSIRHAIKNNSNAVYIEGGSAGPLNGAVITVYQSSQVKGEVQKEGTDTYKYFIPNFLTEEINKTIDYNPELRTRRDIAYMQAFGGTYKLDNGTTITDFDENGGAILHEFEEGPGTYLDEQSLLSIITSNNKRIISVKNLKANAGIPKFNYTADEIINIKHNIAKQISQDLGIPMDVDVDKLPNKDIIKSQINDLYNKYMNIYHLNVNSNE